MFLPGDKAKLLAEVHETLRALTARIEALEAESVKKAPKVVKKTQNTKKAA